MKRNWTRAIVGAAMMLFVSPLFAQLDNASCMKCHGDRALASMRPEALAAMVRAPEGETRVLRSQDDNATLFITESAFDKSVHGGIKCVDCHRGIERLPHNQRLAALTCTDCHADVQDALKGSVHEQKDGNGRRRPNCMDCHGEPHQIPAKETPRTFTEAKAIVASCEKCHNESDHQEFNPVESYRENVHGDALYRLGLPISATCADCHGYHQVLPAENEASTLHPTNVPDTCGQCHEGIEDIYFTSVHGQHLKDGDKNAATCTSCHHSHGIQEIGEPFLLAVVEECSHCHLELGDSYLRSYHGKATELGYGFAAVCSSCHGAHDILPASNPDSRVAKENLVGTCGKCHPDANENFVEYIAHVDFTDREKNPPVYWTFVIMTSLLLGTLCVFIPHTILWFQRTLIGRLKNPAGPHLHAHKHRQIRRFSLIHRLTHALIIISFMGLVLTGFPLKYSYTDWAHNLTNVFGGIPMMGLMHRLFAIITFLYAGLHGGFLLYFFLKKCPKPRWRYILGPDSMLFSLKDLKDFVAMVRWFLWLGPRPKLDRWAYFEKFDYWGEIWGVFVIGGSGLLLWFPTLFTRWLPGWVLNCAMVMHSIEALLAASVIFLIHFFNTHLRPEKFPIDMSMYTGYMSEEEMIEERGREYERLVAEGKLDARVVQPMALGWRIVGVVLGMSAFLLGISLIILAAKTELGQFF